MQTDIWTSLLASAVNDKVVPERCLLVTGGSTDTQNAYLQQFVSSAAGTRYTVRASISPSGVASFALGYAYYDLMDREQDELLLRLHIYTFPGPQPEYSRLVVDLLSRHDVLLEDVLLVVLLDWNEPRRWLRDLARTILFLKNQIFPELPLDEYSHGIKKAAERYKLLSSTSFRSELGHGLSLNVDVPLGTGEYDAPLGVDMLVAVMNSERIDVLERQFGRKDDEFDFIQQFLRTVLLKHGASLVYLSCDSKTPFQLVYYLLSPSLGSQSAITSAAKSVMPNVIDRDAILIPSGWDSWSKILLIRDDFDVEGVSSGWSSEVLNSDSSAFAGEDENEEGTATIIEAYEDVVHAFGGARRTQGEAEVVQPAVDTQAFLKETLAEQNSIKV
ncbi:dynein light intermediate chain-domain-containing protein [Limtongia smithiae]|uniref:dynein light intermediate chain-domain-containing protein n=1 Tax=Limtongia smithiae TaxID=1125753 RepID=UPI0034CE7C8A